MLASMIGIPLEVRHVTFVTGQLAYAGMQRGPEGVLHADYLMSLGSILLVGALNFGVSFALALWVAFRARDVRASEQARLLFAVLKRFREAPLDFLRAPKEAPAADVQAPVPLLWAVLERQAPVNAFGRSGFEIALRFPQSGAGRRTKAEGQSPRAGLRWPARRRDRCVREAHRHEPH